MSAPPPSPVTTAPRSAWLALVVLLGGAFMSLLDTTIVNVALPTIRTSLDASESTLSWIISGYALAFGLALIPAGRFGDRFGHTWVFVAGLALFTVASVGCGLAQNDLQLIIARVVQGLGGGIFYPAVAAFIQLLFPPMTRGKAFAVLGAAIGVSSALGPLVGGVLIQALGDETGWRWIFAVNLPIGILVLGAAVILLPAEAARRKVSADLIGLVLLSGSLVALLVPLIQGQDEGWPLWTFLSLGSGVLLLGIFGLWERSVARRGRDALVPPRLFSHPQFTSGTILALVFFAAFTSIFFTISLFWQAGLGHSALEAGLVSVPFAVGNIIGASQSDRLAARLGRSVLAIGVGLLTIGLVWLFLVLLLVPTADPTNWTLFGPLLVGGLGSGLFIAPNTRFIVATVERSEAGAASGVIGTMQRIGAAAGIAVIGSVFFGNIGPIAGPADLPGAFAAAATPALAVSAALSFVAFLLVFTLPKRVELH